MKVVAGSHGNDAIGPLAVVGGGITVRPVEQGPRAGGSIHIDRDVSVSHGWLRVVEGTSRDASVRGAVA